MCAFGWVGAEGGALELQTGLLAVTLSVPQVIGVSNDKVGQTLGCTSIKHAGCHRCATRQMWWRMWARRYG